MRGVVNGRRGFTLVELVVAMVLALLVGGVVQGHLVLQQRLARAHGERTALQDNVRVAAWVITGELEALGYDEVSPAAAAATGYPVGVRPDLLAVGAGSVTYMAARGSGFTCAVAPGTPAEVRVEAGSWSAQRAPRATDSLLIYAEGDGSTSSDDVWLRLGIAGSAPATCPDGTAALAIVVGVPAGLAPAALLGVTAGAPVRLVETMELRHYASGGHWWLGMRSVSTGEAVTPLAGPLADSATGARGLALDFLDAAGTATSDPAAVRAIDVGLLGTTDGPVHRRHVGPAVVDSFALRTRVVP